MTDNTLSGADLRRLRASADDESLSYGEIAEIEAAFAEVPDSELEDHRENATAEDMLRVLEDRAPDDFGNIYVETDVDGTRIAFLEHSSGLVGQVWHEDHALHFQHVVMDDDSAPLGNEPVTIERLIETAKRLAGEEGQNEQYHRGVCELIATVMAGDANYLAVTAAVLRPEHEAYKAARR